MESVPVCKRTGCWPYICRRWSLIRLTLPKAKRVFCRMKLCQDKKTGAARLQITLELIEIPQSALYRNVLSSMLPASVCLYDLEQHNSALKARRHPSHAFMTFTCMHLTKACMQRNVMLFFKRQLIPFVLLMHCFTCCATILFLCKQAWMRKNWVGSHSAVIVDVLERPIGGAKNFHLD